MKKLIQRYIEKRRARKSDKEKAKAEWEEAVNTLLTLIRDTRKEADEHEKNGSVEYAKSLHKLADGHEARLNLYPAYKAMREKEGKLVVVSRSFGGSSDTAFIMGTVCMNTALLVKSPLLVIVATAVGGLWVAIGIIRVYDKDN